MLLQFKNTMNALEFAQSHNIIYPSNEIYNYPAGFYNYGEVGLRIKNKIINLWRNIFVRRHNFMEIDTALITPEIVLKASGHYDNFTDPLVRCKKTGMVYRADKIVEAAGRVWDPNRANELLKDLRSEHGGEFSEVMYVNLMFRTEIGYNSDQIAFLRPETAQGMFVDFPRFYKYNSRLPMAIAQVGKSFRNEISPRQGLLRLREFNQMEVEYFFDPKNPSFKNFEIYAGREFNIRRRGSDRVERITVEKFMEEVMDNQIMAAFLAMEWEFYMKLGLDPNRMWIRELESSEVPHYSKGNFDVEVITDYGVVEIAGNAYRTDYDLSRHKQFSKGSFPTPHVVEASLGLERLFYVILEQSFRGDRFEFNRYTRPYDMLFITLGNVEGFADYQKLIERFDVLYMDWKGEAIKKIERARSIGVNNILIKDLIGYTYYDGSRNIRLRSLDDIFNIAP